MPYFALLEAKNILTVINELLLTIRKLTCVLSQLTILASSSLGTKGRRSYLDGFGRVPLSVFIWTAIASEREDCGCCCCCCCCGGKLAGGPNLGSADDVCVTDAIASSVLLALVLLYDLMRAKAVNPMPRRVMMKTVNFNARLTAGRYESVRV